MLRPLFSKEVLAGDIVFATVQPGDRHYIGLVWAVVPTVDKHEVYHIGNNRYNARARWNGWCRKENIHGYVPLECISGYDIANTT